jgi:hypothetical protein
MQNLKKKGRCKKENTTTHKAARSIQHITYKLTTRALGADTQHTHAHRKKEREKKKRLFAPRFFLSVSVSVCLSAFVTEEGENVVLGKTQHHQRWWERDDEGIETQKV